jgi:hypothetical protein
MLLPIERKWVIHWPNEILFKYLFFFFCGLNRPHLWSGRQSSWLQIQRYGLDSRHYQIFWEGVGLEQGLSSLVSRIEKLLERKIIGSGPENREYGRRDPSRWARGTLYLQNLELTSSTSGGHSVCTVHSRTQATEFFYGLNNVFRWRIVYTGSFRYSVFSP